MGRANQAGIYAGVVAVAGAGVVAWVSAGPLNPPLGGVAGTYKTLTEVEPRTAISPANTPGDADSVYRIAQPGSYYLTGNITGVTGKAGIEIAANNVTLDLGGFTLSGVSGALSGVTAPSIQTNITIRGGIIAGWPQSGVS